MRTKTLSPLPPTLCATLLAVGLAACATRRPPTELADARAAYTRALAGSAPQAAPEALADARRALDAAERKQAEDGGSSEARDLAYVAHRKTLVAEANARSSRAETETAQALQLLTTLRRTQLADAENRLERAEDKAALEARPLSSRGAKEALDRLTPFAAVSIEPNGTVVRLAGSVLFEGDTAELMATARERLDRVAQAVHEVPTRSVLVRGHMDRSGDTRRDLELSRRRAAAVRAYLVSRGVPATRVRAEGVGHSDPEASNASHEGRAENRRIEIILERNPNRDAIER